MIAYKGGYYRYLLQFESAFNIDNAITFLLFEVISTFQAISPSSGQLVYLNSARVLIRYMWNSIKSHKKWNKHLNCILFVFTGTTWWKNDNSFNPPFNCNRVQRQFQKFRMERKFLCCQLHILVQINFAQIQFNPLNSRCQE